MSIRPLGIFSGVSCRLIALAALVALLAAPSRGHAVTEFNVPFTGGTNLECGDGTKFVVFIEAAEFQGYLRIFKNGQQVSYLEANIEDPVLRPLKDRLEDFCESTGHSQSLSVGRTTSHGITVGRVAINTGGQGATDAVGGDFNGDGRPDFAVANQDSNNVSILLNSSGGTLQSGVTFPAGAGPQRIKAGDFNKDGALDLITANVGNGLAGNLTVLLGNGNGTFQPPIAVAAGILPVDVAVGDWNGDGKLDIAAADSRGFAVVVRLGNGDGTFQPPLVLPTSEAPQSIVAADLNGDGKLDLVTNGSILLGNGNGTFQAAVSFATGFRPTLVRVADVNGDGKPDLITASSTSGLVSVLLGTGDGTFQAPRHYAVGRNPSEVVIVDLDDDGTLDLVVSNLSDDHLSLLFGRGDGTFRGAVAYAAVPDLSIRQGAASVAVADVNGDGIPDVIVANDRTNANGLPAAVVLPGIGLGRFGAPVVIPNQNGSAVVAGDWNNDGKIDVAFTVQGSPGASRLSVLLGTGNFAFTPMAPIVLPDSDASTDFLATADLNHDGKADLIVANTGAASVSVFLGDGAGNFAVQSPVPVGTRPNWVAIGDVNGDGKLDLVVSSQGDFGAVNGTLSVHLGNGNGSFQPAQTILGGIAPNSVAVGDFNGDGKLDVAAVVEKPLFTWTLSVFLGNGDGTFAAPTAAAVFESPAGTLRVADIDLDGHLDLVMGLEGSAVGVLRGRGDGSFEPPVRSDAAGTLAVIADVNRDARPDAIVATGLGAVTVLLNDTLTAALPTTVASVLPASRAVSVGATATAFTTILNPSGLPFTGCDITPIATLPGTFLYQTTDRATNAPTGAPNTRVTIPAGDFQTFVIAFTTSGAFPATEVEFAFACDGVIPAAAIRSVNTLRLSASATPGPDIIALAASSLPGRIVVAGAGAFAVATANVGASGTVRVAADTGGASLPLALAWCQTNPGTGVCLGAPTSAPLEVVVGAGATPTFAIFAAAAGNIAFDPAVNRVFFRILSPGGQVIGATSVAVSGGP